MNKYPNTGGSYVRDEAGQLHRTSGREIPATGGGNAETIIYALKKRHGVKSDQELADVLGLGRSTVTSWRRRGSVPKRIAVLVDHDAKERLSAVFNFDQLSIEERSALILAVMRMHRTWLKNLDSYPEFLRNGGFIPTQLASHTETALFDILGELDQEKFTDPQQCLNALVFREFFE